MVLQGSLIPSQFLKESGNEVVQNRDNIFASTQRSPFQRPKVYHFDDGDHLDFDREPKKPSTPIFDDITNDVTDWKVGDIVIHKKLGRGVVVALEGDDIIKVNFEEHGEKSILGTHPSVSKGGHEA